MNETKLKILKVAFTLFLQKGFKEVTMNNILENSELSRGTFYYYFKSKEQLFAEVIDLFYLIVPSTLQKPLNENSLYDYCHDYLERSSHRYALLSENIKDTNVDVYNYFSLSLDAMKRLPDFREKMRIVNVEILKFWIKVIKTAREKGEISSLMTDEQIACFYKFTMEGMGMKSKLEGKSSSDNNKELIALWDNFYSQIKN